MKSHSLNVFLYKISSYSHQKRKLKKKTNFALFWSSLWLVHLRCSLAKKPQTSLCLALLLSGLCKAVENRLHIITSDGAVYVRPCDWLIEVGFGNGEEAAVSLGSNSEYQGLPSQDGQLTDKFSRMRHKQTRLFFTVNHPLVNVEEARNHKQDAHLLKHREERVAQI